MLEHDWNGIHYDFLLEREEKCLTFAFESIPFDSKGGICERKSDHRKHYLTYEGPVSGGRGTVNIIGEGEYKTLEEGAGKIELELNPPEKKKIILELLRGREWRFRVTPNPET
ncbi:MAG: hypothetical protein ACYS8W_06105 [Planctomycetota bacterium]